MTNEELAELLFPNIDKTIKDYEKLYPKRDMDPNSRVTRFAPSPTGFVHIGNFFQTLISYINAKSSNGLFYLRNEDTDKKREKDGAMDLIIDVLFNYDIIPDEYQKGDYIKGNYGPYVQSERIEIYHTFIKEFIKMGRAYPCFCTSEELEDLRNIQTNNKKRIGYYGKYAKCRNLSLDDIKKKIESGIPYVIRFKSNGNFNNKVIFTDLVKGNIEFPENDLDVVIMKSSNKLPTYHFAHLVDDYLMGTTHVTRGEEWLSSVPLHIELFKTLGVKQPEYIHNPLIMKKDGDIVRKLSKRKDPETSMTFYDENGFPPICVIESLMTIINSNYEEWRDNNPDKSYLEFEFDPQKMSSSGALYSIDKLKNITKNYLSKLKAEDLYNKLIEWAKKYDTDFYNIISENKEYTVSILNIEREGNKPRKDFSCYKDIKPSIFYMFNELFEECEEYEWQKINNLIDIKEILNTYLDKYYDINDSKEEWFNKCKKLCDDLGYASDMKAYKKNPENFKGNVADVTTVIRVALTKKSQTPDLYELLKLLGINNIKNRFDNIK